MTPTPLRHWKVTFTRRGCEPPRPCGMTVAIVCAESRDEAKRQVPSAPGYRVSASLAGDGARIGYPFNCRCGRQAVAAGTP